MSSYGEVSGFTVLGADELMYVNGGKGSSGGSSSSGSSSSSATTSSCSGSCTCSSNSSTKTSTPWKAWNEGPAQYLYRGHAKTDEDKALARAAIAAENK